MSDNTTSSSAIPPTCKGCGLPIYGGSSMTILGLYPYHTACIPNFTQPDTDRPQRMSEERIAELRADIGMDGDGHTYGPDWWQSEAVEVMDEFERERTEADTLRAENTRQAFIIELLENIVPIDVDRAKEIAATTPPHNRT